MILKGVPHVVGANHAISVAKNGSIEQVLVVKTDLPLDSQDPAFDSSALDDVVDAASQEMKKNTSINRVQIEN